MRFLVQIVFVECEHLAAAHENLAINNHGVGASAMCAIDEICNWIVNGLPLGPHDVEEGDVGFLSDFERAEFPVPLHAPRAVDRQHLDRRLGAKYLGIEASFMQAAHDQKRLPDRVQIVARHGLAACRFRPAGGTADAGDQTAYR